MISTLFFFFFFNDTATTEIYTLSLHDALPISLRQTCFFQQLNNQKRGQRDFFARLKNESIPAGKRKSPDRKSTRLNSSHLVISYAVFCLKKKKNNTTYTLKSALKKTQLINKTK